MSSKIQLSDHFTYKRLLRFIWPSVVMMVFISIYGVVDGFFVSNFVGKTEFAALNFIMPFIMVLASPGFMLGTGGSALVSKTLGEGKPEKANQLFSMFCTMAIVAGAVVMVAAFFLLPAVASAMGAEGQLLDDSVLYGRVLILGTIPQMLHFLFESFIVTAEKPKLGLRVTLAAGITNIILDAVFVGWLGWGLAGAAAATVIGQSIGGFIPLFYFYRPNNSRLRIDRTARFDGKALAKGCANGSSELVSNISMSLIGVLYNVQLLKYLGENGVAAYGVIMYVNFIFISMYIGYAIGTAPIVGFHYGAGNKSELQSILRKSFLLIGSACILMTLFGELLAEPLSRIFVSYDPELLELTVHAFRIFSFTFLFCGFAIFGSSFFTALNDGLTSAIISFLRTLVFEMAAILLLPVLVGADGIWYATLVPEFMAVVVWLCFLIGKRKKYGYFK